MGNEGKLVAIVSKKDADRALEIIRSSRYGEHAAIVGKVSDGQPVTVMEKICDEQSGNECSKTIGKLILKTRIGGRRVLKELQGEGLPRIC